MSPMGVMLSGVAKKMDKDYKNNGNVKWNFTKFLIDRNGEIVARFEPTDMKKPVRKVADTVGVAVADEEFHCRGQFGRIHKGRPNNDDIEALISFAKNIIAE